MEDTNRVVLVGRLTRDAELSYIASGTAICKMGLAVNSRKKEGDNWVDEANFFDLVLWGKRGESLNQYLLRGVQIACEGRLKQERWEQDGQKRSKVTIEVDNIQLLGSKSDGGQPQGNHGGYGGQQGSGYQGNSFQNQNTGVPAF